jgi:hypothetical protein
MAEFDVTTRHWLLNVCRLDVLGIGGGTRRIDRSDDWVRFEVAPALQQKKLVIPCLVGGAKMPDKDKLPADIAELSSRHAVSVSQENPRRDAGELIKLLRNWRRSS